MYINIYIIYALYNNYDMNMKTKFLFLIKVAFLYTGSNIQCTRHLTGNCPKHIGCAAMCKKRHLSGAKKSLKPLKF